MVFRGVLEVKVLEIRGEKVKLGFDVDPDVPVHRLEVWERVFGKGPTGQPESEETAPII